MTINSQDLKRMERLNELFIQRQGLELEIEPARKHMVLSFWKLEWNSNKRKLAAKGIKIAEGCSELDFVIDEAGSRSHYMVRA